MKIFKDLKNIFGDLQEKFLLQMRVMNFKRKVKKSEKLKEEVRKLFI